MATPRMNAATALDRPGGALGARPPCPPCGAEPPPGEDADVVQKGDSATALGKTISQRYERVEYQFGKPKVAVSVRYNKAVEPGDLPR